MGHPKSLLPFRGRPWIEAQLSLYARANGIDAAIVVSDPERHARALPWIPSGSVFGLRVATIAQDHPEEPQFSSLQLGLRGFLDRGALVLPVDVPTSAPVLSRLGACARDAIPVYEGRAGHPVSISPAFASHLVSLDPSEPDARLDRQLAKIECERVAVEEPSVLVDFDTPETWETWKSSEAAARNYSR
jgi:molybdenum cofactor cytidylyltransferase